MAVGEARDIEMNRFEEARGCWHDVLRPVLLAIGVPGCWPYAKTREPEKEKAMLSGYFRMEHDFLGDREVPADAHYGIQTLRGKENFHITGMPISREPPFRQGVRVC